MLMTRRESLTTIAGAVAAGLVTEVGVAAPSQARVRVGTIAELKARQTLLFSYPDSASPAQAVRLASGQVVAYSLVCTHMGCTVGYNGPTASFECPCHHSVFSAARKGSVESGPAPRPLPEIALHIDETGTIYATGLSAPVFGAPENADQNQRIYHTGGGR